MNSTVLLHTAGLAVSALSTSCVYHAPCTGLDGPGCSEYVAGATIHDTCGSWPAAMSSFNACRKPPSGMVLPTPLISGLTVSSAGVYGGNGLPSARLPRAALASR